MKKITVELDERLLKRVELKRNFTELGANAFFIEAINEYQPALKNNRTCFKCGDKMKEEMDEISYELELPEGEAVITIQNFPMFNCMNEQCDESTMNSKTYGIAKDLINDEIKNSSDEKVKTVYDFKELLKLK